MTLKSKKTLPIVSQTTFLMQKLAFQSFLKQLAHLTKFGYSSLLTVLLQHIQFKPRELFLNTVGDVIRLLLQTGNIFKLAIIIGEFF